MSPVKHLRLKRFLAKYVKYVTWGGYGLVIAVVATVIALWFVKINLYCNSNTTVAGLLKPLEHAVTPTSDTVVLRFLVKNGDDVVKGQPLAEYCDDPGWIARMRAGVHLAALAEDLERGGVGLPNGLSAAQARAQAESLESLRSSPPFRKTFEAAGPGVVLLAETAAEPVIAGGAPLMGVHDLDDLRITTTMVGGNINNVAIGREALVELRTQNHSDKLVLVIEAEGEYPSDWPELRFSNLGGSLVAEKIGEALKGYSVFVENDGSETPVPYSFDTIKVGTFRAMGRSARDGEPRDMSLSSKTDMVNGREFK
ncbi:MAG: hypothetical protein NTW86_08885, partial [Candidatus Sumerlaeota bacterium]|nr:hypothetical protein [Candidatus Sumerlaeota bacterium]